MARKTLLTEAEIRSFMKLAEIEPLGKDKLAEIFGASDEIDEGRGDDDDDDPPGMKTMREEDDEMDVPMDDDVPALDGPEEDDLAPPDDMGDDMADVGAADAGAKMVSIEDFMSALEDALQNVLDDEVEVDMEDEMDDEMPEDDMDPMGDAPEDMMGDEDPPGMAAPARMMEEEIVNEVARRVAARLQKQNNKAEMVDQLAERILNKLTSK